MGWYRFRCYGVLSSTGVDSGVDSAEISAQPPEGIGYASVDQLGSFLAEESQG